MKLNEIKEPIYKIEDLGNKEYSAWYGTEDDIIEYCEEQGYFTDDEQDFCCESWCDALANEQLTFTQIN